MVLFPGSMPYMALGYFKILFMADLPGKTTAMDGGRDCSRQSSAFPPSMEVRSAGAAGSGSSKNLEGLTGYDRSSDELLNHKSRALRTLHRLATHELNCSNRH